MDASCILLVDARREEALENGLGRVALAGEEVLDEFDVLIGFREQSSKCLVGNRKNIVGTGHYR